MANEFGYAVCKTASGFLRTPTVRGGRDYVDIPVRGVCPGGRPYAINHVHPSGDLRLSDADKSASRKHGIPIVCVENSQRTRTRCFRVKGK